MLSTNELSPSVYRYEFRDCKHCLYMGAVTTIDGLNLFPGDSHFRICHIYADTISTVPDHLKSNVTLDKVRQLLVQASGIVDFECLVEDQTTFSSHDDSECHFQFHDKASCEATLRKAANAKVADALWNTLLARPGVYLVVDSRCAVTGYETFEEYLLSQQ